MDHAERFAPADLLAALPRLRRYARVLVGERDGGDALVEATLAGVQDAGCVRPRGADLVPWLFGLMHAAHRPRPQPSAASVDSGGICDRLLRLPLEEREVLLLVAVERLAYTEIASLLDVPVASVLARLARARAHLSEIDPR